MTQTPILDTRNRTLIATLLLIWVVIGFDQWWQNHATTTAQPLALDGTEVDEIRIQAKDQTMQLSRREEGWWLQQPVQIAADQRRVEQLLAILDQPAKALSIDSRPALLGSLEAEDRAAFGLTDDAIGLGFDSLQLLIGARSPVRELHYAAHENRIFLLRIPSLQFARQGISGLVSPWPFAGAQAIQRMQLTIEDGSAIELDQQTLGPWFAQLRAASVQPAASELQALRTDSEAPSQLWILEVELDEKIRRVSIGRLGNLVVLRQQELAIDYYLSTRSSQELIKRIDTALVKARNSKQ